MTRRDTWAIYLLMVCQGFLFYSIGFLTPYVESELGAPTWASAAPNSMMAIGLLAAAIAVPRAIRTLGAWGAASLWAAMIAGAAVLVAFGASLPTLLVGALLTGIAGAGSLTHAVTQFTGRQGGVLVMRATLASVVGGVLGPLVLSVSVRSVGWNWGILAPVPLAIGLAVVIAMGHRAGGGASEAADAAAGAGGPSVEAGGPSGEAGKPAHPREARLGRPYWLAWLFLVLCVGAESSFVAWGAQVAVEQTGIPLADATALGSLFILGQVIGRIGLGAGDGLATEPRRLLAVMVLVGLAGGILLWLGGTAAVAGAAFLMGGLGLAGVWATTASLALAHAPGAPVTGGARLSLATGLPILVAPLVLGVVAGSAGVLVAWAFVLGLLGVALAVLRLVPGAVRRPAEAIAPT